MLKKRIGIFIPNIHKVGYHNHLNCISIRAAENGYDTMCFSSYTDLYNGSSYDEGEKSIFHLAYEADLCAMIIYSELIKDEALVKDLVDFADAHGIPAFAIDKKVKGAYYIGFDYETAFEKITDHIVEQHGAKNVYMISGQRNNSFSQDREEAYRRSLEKHGIAFDQNKIYYGEFWDHPAMQAVRDILKDCGGVLPDAIVCANDSMAIAACTALEENGVAVPEDIIVSGFDGIERAVKNCPSILTAKYDFEKSAEYMIDEIIRLEGSVPQPCDKIFGFDIVLGQSCGCIDNSARISGKITSQLYDMIGQREEFKSSMDHMMLYNNTGDELQAVLPGIGKYVKSILYCGVAIYIYPEFFGYSKKDYPDRVLAAYLDPENLEYFTPFAEVDSQEIYPVSIFKNCSNFVFVPLHCQDRVYGYVMISRLTLSFLAFDRLADFVVHLNMLLSSIENAAKLNEVVNVLNDMYIRDPLTNLLNRRGFDREIPAVIMRAEKENKKLLLLSADLDGLKFINDSFGHSEGDFAIYTVAYVLEDTVSDMGVCARFGGDEFMALLVTDITPAELEKRFSDKINEASRAANKPYRINASIGIEEAGCDEMVNSFKEVVKRADSKMYKHKKKNKHIKGFRFAEG